MSFRIFNIGFSVSVPFCVMLSFLLLSDNTGLMSASLLAVAVHEIGHLVMMKHLRSEPNEIILSIGGILMVGSRYCTARESVLIALSGPFVNLSLTAVLWCAAYFTDIAQLYALAAVQFLVGAVNLLPIKGLDGGTVLKSVFFKLLKRNAGLVTAFISVLTAVAITVLGLAVAVKNTNNPSLLLLGIYLIIINISRFNAC